MNYQIPYSNTILENLNFDIQEKEFFGVLGHNGSGKTTLMDLLMGFRKATSGKLEVLGEDPHESERHRKNQIIFISQDVGLKGNISIRDFLDFHALLYPKYSKQEELRLLEVFKMDQTQKIGALSLGQQKKLQIVAGFSSAPNLILIDEITAVLDPETRETFFKELEDLRQKHSTTILLATNIAEDLITRAGRILFIEGRSASIHNPSDIKKLFNIETAA